MAGIDAELKQISSAIYGKDVRKAIHDALEKTYKATSEDAFRGSGSVAVTPENYSSYGIYSPDDIPVNESWVFNHRLTDVMVSGLPEYGQSMNIFHYSNKADVVASGRVQIAIVWSGNMYFRYYHGENPTWSDWVHIPKEGEIDKKFSDVATQMERAIKSSNINTVSASNYETLGLFTADNIPLNECWRISYDITEDMIADLPVYGSVNNIMCFTYWAGHTTGAVQISFTNQNDMYYRHYHGEAWQPWTKVAKEKDFYQVMSESKSKVYPANIEWEEGYLNSKGEIVASPVYKISKLIKIPKEYSMVFNVFASPSTFYFAEYTSSGSFIKIGDAGLGKIIEGFLIDAIEDRYVKICTNTNHVALSSVNARFVKMEAKYVTEETKNPLAPNTSLVYESGYISSSTNAVVVDDYYLHSDLIYLQKGQTIEFKCSGSKSVWLLSEWDRSYNFVKGLVAGDSKYRRLQYTADKNMWIRTCSRVIVASGGSPYVPSSEYKKLKLYYKSLRYSNEKLYGKKIVVIGDSLIHGNLLSTDATWCRILELETGAVVYNYGINGNAISNVAGASGTPMSERYAIIPEITDADIIIVEGGANDKNKSCRIGLDSDIENSTFKGACNVLIDGLRNVNSNAIILFMTTYHRYDNINTLSLREQAYADAMLDVCRNKAVPCFDNCFYSGITFLDENLKAWCDEGVYLKGESNSHFSPKGYEYLYPKYKSFIESNI